MGVVAYQELLSNCYSLIRPKNTSPSGDQGQAMKAHPLCGLHASPSFSNAAGSLRGQGIPASFSKRMEEYLGCAHLLVSARWHESIVSTCDPQLQHSSRRMPQLLIPTGLNKAVEECPICAYQPLLPG